MPKRTDQSVPSATVISKSSGLEVDRKRSLAARKAAATRKANQESNATGQRLALRLHHKLIAIGGIAAVIAVAAIGIHSQLTAFAILNEQVGAQGFQNDNGLCMDNSGSVKRNGNLIISYKCNASKAQTWNLDSDGKIKNANGFCLDTPGTNPKAGDKATLRECGSKKEMRWTYSGHAIINKAVRLCLSGGATGKTLTLQKCSSSDSQKWTYKYVTTMVSSTTSHSTPVKQAPKYSEKRTLAMAIMNSGKVSFISYNGVSAGERGAVFRNIANGKTSGNSLPCGLNIRVLKAVKKLVDNHKKVLISDTNSLCNHLNIRSLGSRHYYGNGSALDIAGVDGVSLNGSNAKSIQVLKELKPLLLTGSNLHNQSQVGQINCRGYLNLGKVHQFEDSCSHVHIDFPPWSDSKLKYRAGAF